MERVMRARLHLSDELEAFLQESASTHHREMNDEIVSILSERMHLAKEQRRMNRPCIIGVGLAPNDQEAIKSGLDYLHTLFSHVDGKQEKDSFNVLCAGPKNGLTYDEAFLICQKRYFEVGWVYADAAYEARS